MSYVEMFDALSLAEIESFVGKEETLHLEFKTVNKSDLSHRDDRKIFSIAVSGFGNSDGGVIVWGVDAHKTDGIDCGQSLKPIKDIALFVSRLTELTGESVLPRIDGIRHRMFALPDKSGFAASLIPVSDGGPHMAKLGENRYYKRSGTSFYPMEHFDIADMFGKRKTPKLSVTYRQQGFGSDVKIILGLRNDGRGSARAPYLAFSTKPPFKRDEFGLDGNRNEGMRRLPFIGSELPFRYGEGASVVIHPGITHEVAVVSLGLFPKPGPTHDAELEYVFCAEDLPLERGKIIVPIKALLGQLEE